MEHAMIPTGQLTENESNFTPAPIGELPLTIWNLCGMLIMQTNSGRPLVKNPLVFRESWLVARRNKELAR